MWSSVTAFLMCVCVCVCVPRKLTSHVVKQTVKQDANKTGQDVVNVVRRRGPLGMGNGRRMGLCGVRKALLMERKGKKTDADNGAREQKASWGENAVTCPERQFLSPSFFPKHQCEMRSWQVLHRAKGRREGAATMREGAP